MRPGGSPARHCRSTAATPSPSESSKGAAMKVDLYLYRPALEEMPGRGRQAEQGGFDGLFVAESTGDPFQNLAVASQHTSRVTLGTSVALAFPRSPSRTAVSARALQRATNL